MKPSSYHEKEWNFFFYNSMFLFRFFYEQFFAFDSNELTFHVQKLKHKNLYIFIEKKTGTQLLPDVFHGTNEIDSFYHRLPGTNRNGPVLVRKSTSL